MQQMQDPQSAVARTKRRRRISARTWRLLLVIAALIIIVVFILASLGDFPTIMGMTPLVFAAILSGCVGILSLLVGVIPFIHDELRQDANTQPPISTPAYNFSGPVYFNSPPTSPQPVDTTTTNTVAEAPTNNPLKRPSGSLSLHRTPTIPTNPKTIQQREEMVKQVYQELAQPEISSIVLTAIGGQGKSTLAALVFNYAEAQRHSNSGPFQDVSLWFDVGQDMLFSELASDILYALDVSIPDFKTRLPRNQALTLFNVLNTREKPRLIVLNQFENLLDWGTGKAATASSGIDDFVDALNSNPCTCRVLLTSRPRPAGTRSQPASCLVEYEVDGLAIAEGIDLLRKQGVSTQQATDEDLREVVKRCDGHAFALVLLATLLQNRSLTVKALLNNPNYNQKWGANIAHQLLDDIVNRLTPIQHELLLAFSIYREPVSIDAARAIMTTTYENEQEQIALDALYNQHLLQSPEISTKQDEPCYQLHAIVAEYAQSHFVIGDKQANEDALHKAHEKAAQYYVQMGQTTCPEPDKRHQLEDVQPFVEAIRQYCDAKQWQEAYKLMVKENFFSTLSLWSENPLLLELCQILLNGNWILEDQKLIIIYLNLCRIYDFLGKKQEALHYSEQELHLTQHVGDRRGEATALNDLGMVYKGLGEKQQALGYFQQALQILQCLENQEDEGTVLNNLGTVYSDLGDKQKALDYFGQALTLRRLAGDQRGVGQTLNNLGGVYNDLEDKQKALDYFGQALILWRAVGDRYGEATTLHNIGILNFEQQNYKTALAHFCVAKNILVKIQSPDSSDEQSWINSLRSNVGEKQFTQLLTQVEPRAQQIVDDALHHEQDH